MQSPHSPRTNAPPPSGKAARRACPERGWKKCRCIIHVSGTLDGKFSRRQTAAHDLKLNELLVKCFESYRQQQGD